MSEILSISGFKLPGKTEVQKTFTLNAGERIAVMGPSGSGKTTLLRAICLLDPHSESTLKYRGEPIPVGTEPAYRTQVMYIAQHSLRAPISTESHLAQLFSLKIHSSPQAPSFRERLQQAHTLATLMGKPKLIGELRLDQISGGESQILAMIRALLIQPRVLCLDEPTSALDSESRERAEKILADQHHGEWIWVTHDDRQATRVGQRTSHLNELIGLQTLNK